MRKRKEEETVSFSCFEEQLTWIQCQLDLGFGFDPREIDFLLSNYIDELKYGIEGNIITILHYDNITKIITKKFNNFEHQKNWIKWIIANSSLVFDNNTLNELQLKYHKSIKYIITDRSISLIDNRQKKDDPMDELAQALKLKECYTKGLCKKEANEMQELIKEYIAEQIGETNNAYNKRIREVIENNAIMKEFNKFKKKVEGMIKTEFVDRVDEYFTCNYEYNILTDEEKKELARAEDFRDKTIKELVKKEKTLITLLNACETYQQKTTLLVDNDIIDTDKISV